MSLLTGDGANARVRPSSLTGAALRPPERASCGPGHGRQLLRQLLRTRLRTRLPRVLLPRLFLIPCVLFPMPLPTHTASQLRLKRRSGGRADASPFVHLRLHLLLVLPLRLRLLGVPAACDLVLVVMLLLP